MFIISIISIIIYLIATLTIWTNIYEFEKEKTLISSSESNLIFKGVMSNDNYIYLIFDNYKEYCDNICDILEKYNFECKDVVINPHFIRLELEGGKRNFAMNILHHYFISKNN